MKKSLQGRAKLLNNYCCTLYLNSMDSTHNANQTYQSCVAYGNNEVKKGF